MKKFLVLASVLLMLTLAFVACTETKPGEETTGENVTVSDPATDAPTEAPTAAPTEEPTAAPTEEPTAAPTEEPTDTPTEEPTEEPTEAPTEPEKYPAWDAAKDVVTHQSFDQLYTGIEVAGNGPENIFAPGASANWDLIADLTASDATVLTYWGWVGVVGEIGQFGYAIDDGEPIYNAEWIFSNPGEDLMPHCPAGTDHATRMKIAIDLAGLNDEHTVRVLYQSADGAEVTLCLFTVKMPEAPKPWDELRDVMVHQSFDQLYYGNESSDHATNNGLNVFAPGGSGTWDKVADLSVGGINCLTYWGWVSVKGEMGTFGYQIDNQTPVFDEGFYFAPEDGLMTHITGTGGDTGSRMKITIDLTDLEGEHNVVVYYKNPEGRVVIMGEFTVKMPVTPAMWDENKDVVANQSFDELRTFAGGVHNGGIFAPGASATWDKIAKVDASIEELGYWGWDAVKGELGSYGYSIDKGAYVFSADFTVDAEEGLMPHIIGSGGDTGSRFLIKIPVAGLTGDHLVRVVYKNPDGTIVRLNEFVVSAPAASETPDEPAVSVAVKVVSQDALTVHMKDGTVQSSYVPGTYDAWNKIVTVTEGSFENIQDAGWISVVSETIVYGYEINGVVTFSDAFYVEPEETLWPHIQGAGGNNGARFTGVITADMLKTGENTVKFLVKLDGEAIRTLREYTVTVNAAA